MRYSELLRSLHTIGVVQVGKQETAESTIAFLGRPEEKIFPYAPELIPIFLDGDDPELHPEVVAAVARRFTANGKLPPIPPLAKSS